MRGALLLNFDEFVKDFGVDYIEVSVNGSIRRIRYQDTNKLYTTPINLNDVVSVSIYTSPTDLHKQISITRKDYTIDAEDGDNGIRDTFITSSSGNSNPLTVTFTGTTTSDAYGFRYTIENYTDGCFPNNNVAFNEQVYDSEIQPDGKILCSGVFTQYSGTNVNNICRLNTDGTLDTTFNYTEPTSFSFGIGDMKLLPDGDIIARIQSFRLGKIKSNGALDTTFNIGNFDQQIAIEEEVIEILSNGNILFGGGFNTYTSAAQTTTKPAIVRLNSNGTIDTTFNQFGTGFTTAATVRDICIQPDGKILLSGGDFISYNGVALNRCGLIRLNSDGSLDTSFITNTSTNVVGYEVELLSDGKILFYNTGGFNGNGNRRLVRLNSDGSLDTTFDGLALSGNTAWQVYDLLVDNLDNTYISGIDLIYSGVSIPSLFRINYNGIKDTTFDNGLGFLGFKLGYDIELNGSGCLYAVGKFSAYYSSSFVSSNIMKIKPDGTPFLC